MYEYIYKTCTQTYTYTHENHLLGMLPQIIEKKKSRPIFSSRLLFLKTKFLISKLYSHFALTYQSKGGRNARTQIKYLGHIHLVTFSTSVDRQIRK